MHVFSETDLAQWISSRLVSSLTPSTRILLSGPLGVGKSTFAKHLISALIPGVFFEGSPTFSIMNSYEGGKIHHLDCYRLKNEAEAFEAGVEEVLFSGEGFVICEWLERFPELEKRVLARQEVQKIEMEFGEGNARRLQLRRRSCPA